MQHGEAKLPPIFMFYDLWCAGLDAKDWFDVRIWGIYRIPIGSTLPNNPFSVAKVLENKGKYED